MKGLIASSVLCLIAVLIGYSYNYSFLITLIGIYVTLFAFISIIRSISLILVKSELKYCNLYSISYVLQNCLSNFLFVVICIMFIAQ